MASRTYRLTLNKTPHTFTINFPVGANTGRWLAVGDNYEAITSFSDSFAYSYDKITINDIILTSSYQTVYTKVQEMSTTITRTCTFSASYSDGTMSLKQNVTLLSTTAQSGKTTVSGYNYVGTFVGQNYTNCDFTIPDTAGTYNLKLNLQSGGQINAGNIVVGGASKTYKLTLVKGSGATIDCGTFSTPSLIPSFANATWAQIDELCKSNSVPDSWAIGDEKTITITVSEQNYDCTLVILGKNHDTLTTAYANGKTTAGLTIGLKQIPYAATGAMNSSHSTVGGWKSCTMRTTRMATWLSRLPADLQEVIKYVNKFCTAGNGSTDIVTTSDKLFLLSKRELDNTTEAGYVGEGNQYEYWAGKTTADRIKYTENGAGSAGWWWLRSPELSTASGVYIKYIAIAATGEESSDYAKYSSGVSFAFCI